MTTELLIGFLLILAYITVCVLWIHKELDKYKEILKAEKEWNEYLNELEKQDKEKRDG